MHIHTVPLLPSFPGILSSRIPSEQSVPPPTVILEGSGRSGRGGREEDEDEEDSQFLVEDATPLDPPPTEAFLGGNETNKPEGSLSNVHDSLVPICPTFRLLLFCTTRDDGSPEARQYCLLTTVYITIRMHNIV